MSTYQKVANELACVVEFFAFEGKEEELTAAFFTLIKETHKEPGCLRYELNQCTKNPQRFVFVEKFANQEAFDSHCSQPYITHFFDNVKPDLVEKFEVNVLKEFAI